MVMAIGVRSWGLASGFDGASKLQVRAFAEEVLKVEPWFKWGRVQKC